MAQAKKHRPPKPVSKSKKVSEKSKAASKPVRSEALRQARERMVTHEERMTSLKGHKLPNVLALTKQALRILVQHKRLFTGISLLYGVLNIIFVTGLGTGVDVAEIRNQFTNHVLGSFVAYTQLVSSPATDTSEGAGVYQLILFVAVSLALVWTFRQVYAGKKVRVRDAYYKGMYPLVPSLLVVLVFGLQLLPMLLGTGVYQYSVANGIAVTSLENIVIGILAIGATLLSFWWATPTLFALYIAALPDMEPMRALRMGRELVKDRRWTVMRKVLFLPLILLLVTVILLMPVILAVPVLSAFWLALFGPILITIGHSYLYALYRELISE